MKFQKSLLRAAKVWRPFKIFPNHEVLRHLALMVDQRPSVGPFREQRRGSETAGQHRRALRRALENAAIQALGGRCDMHCLTFNWRGRRFALCARFREKDKVTIIEIGFADHPLPSLPTTK